MARPRTPVGIDRPGPFEEALSAVARLLRQMGRPCAVIGGMAVIAHGFARATADIDVAVVAGPADVAELLRLAHKAGFSPRVDDAQAFAEQNLVLLLEHSATGVPLDLSLALQAFERDAAAAAVVRRFGSVALPVTPLAALLIYKLVAGRPKDLDDVRALLATGAPFDASAVERTLAEFDVLLDTDRAGDLRRLIRR